MESNPVDPNINNGSLIPDVAAAPVGQEFVQPGTVQSPDLVAGADNVDPDKLGLAAQAYEKYGDRPLTAGVMSGLSGLTLGMSDQIVKRVLNNVKAGSGTELLDGLDTFNPGASGLGLAIGTIAPTILSDGILAPEEGLAASARIAARAVSKFSPLGAAMNLSRTTEAALTAALQGSKAEKILGSVLTKGAAKSVGGIIEFTAFGAQNILNEDALGKADLNANNVLAALGTSALLGGILGPAFGALGAGASRLKSSLGEVIDKTAARYIEPELATEQLTGIGGPTAPKAEAAYILSHGGGEVGQAAYKQYRTDATSILQEILPDVEGSSPLAVFKRVNEEKISTGAMLESSMGDLDKFAGDLKLQPAWRAADNAIDNVLENQNLPKDVQAMLEQKKVDIRALADSRDNSFQSVWKFRQGLDEIANWQSANSRAKPAAYAARQIRAAIQDSMLQGANSVNPEIAQVVKDNFRKYSVLSDMQTSGFKNLKADAGHSVMSLRSTGTAAIVALANPGLGALSAVGGLFKGFLESDMRRKLTILGGIEAANTASLKALQEGVSSFFEKAGSVARPAFSLAAVKLAEGVDGQRPKNEQAAFQNISKQISTLTQNPAALQSNVAKQMAIIGQAAPDTAQQYANQFITNLNFLNGKLPKEAYDLSVPGVAQRTFTPSNADLAKFGRSVQIAESPHSALTELAKGSLTQEHVEALQAMYPALYTNMQQQMLSRMAANEKLLNYQQKLQLGTFLGTPVDHSMLTPNFMALQSTFAPPMAPMGGGHKGGGIPSFSRVKGLNFSGRAASGFEATLNRRRK